MNRQFSKLNLSPITIKTWDYFDPIATARLARVLKQNSVHAVHIHRTQDMGVVLSAADIAGVPKRVLTLRMESRRRKKIFITAGLTAG